MYAYTSSQRTAAPSVTTPVKRTPSGPSNQDQLARAGLEARSSPCAPASELTDTLGMMGDLGSVVLDALPLAIALPLALERRALGWVRAWLAAQSVEALSDGGLRVALDLVEAAFPTGTRITLDAELSAALLAGVTPSRSCSIARTPKGWSVDMTRSLGVAKDVGLGGAVTGAFGAALAGTKVEAHAGADLEATCGWDLPDGLVGTAILGAVGSLRQAICTQDVAALAGVFEALAPALETVAPTRTSVRTTARAGASGVGAALVGGELGAEASVSGAYGLDGRTAWWECRLGGEAGARAISPLLESAGVFVPQDVLVKADGRVGVRVQREGRDEGARWTFSVLRAQSTDTGFSEVFEAADARSFLALLTACIGVRASVADAGALPDVTLVTTASVAAPDAPVAVFASPLVRTALEVAQSLPDQGFAASIRDLRAEATVRVGPEATAIALERTARFGAVTEADVLEVGRAITACVLGRTYSSPVTQGADVDAGASSADVEAAWFARVRTGVGAGINGDVEGLEAGAALRASATIEGRAAMTDRADIAHTFAA